VPESSADMLEMPVIRVASEAATDKGKKQMYRAWQVCAGAESADVLSASTTFRNLPLELVRTSDSGRPGPPPRKKEVDQLT
jgi:hypothetical protein